MFPLVERLTDYTESSGNDFKSNFYKTVNSFVPCGNVIAI